MWLRFCRSSWMCKLMFSFLHPQIREIHNHYFVLYCVFSPWALNYTYVRVLDSMPWVLEVFLKLFFNFFSCNFQFFFVLLKFYSSGFKLSNSVFHRLLSSVKPTWWICYFRYCSFWHEKFQLSLFYYFLLMFEYSCLYFPTTISHLQSYPPLALSIGPSYMFFDVPFPLFLKFPFIYWESLWWSFPTSFCIYL